jgi:hypothetical protein
MTDFPLELRNFLMASGAAEDFAWERLPGGANNRVYRIRYEQQDRVLKWYFQNPQDPRDRFGNERAFYELLWQHGIRKTPEPMGWESRQRLGLFSFVSRQKLAPHEVDRDRVTEALAFLKELNSLKDSDGAQGLATASEACFTFAEHLACVDRRVARLSALTPKDDLDHTAAALVDRELRPFWQQIHPAILLKASRIGLNLEAIVSGPQRCLSPSDFGFHNALVASDGQLRFIDFEYAGWDDPAKLICDFFCQPELPVRSEFHSIFVKQLAWTLKLDALAVHRAWLLWPAYRIKWCCIMLNEFLRTEQARRSFAGGAAAHEDRRRQQLLKAGESLRQTVELWSCHFSGNTPSW